ncbi:hypothetical protein OC846_001145 [Tilletia horrida]|uniref:Uncharacterized protein n=1 Tax=Tilletia horrida TaxID=155126 RepID=A0AAN6GTT0_9BASI|nr:hypothetical protein OC846_001145 [Tilletia horrida]KAK0569378.1 hypothetical protein OC861_000984 [Tilletia horrida]
MDTSNQSRPSSRPVSATQYKGLPYLREPLSPSGSSSPKDPTIGLYNPDPPMSPPRMASRELRANTFGTANDADSLLTAVAETAPPTPKEDRSSEKNSHRGHTRPPSIEISFLNNLPLPPRPADDASSPPSYDAAGISRRLEGFRSTSRSPTTVSSSPETGSTPSGLSKMVQHARLHNKSRAWATPSQDPSPHLEPHQAGLASPPSGLTSQTSTRPSSLAMKYFSPDGSTIADAISEHLPEEEAAWEDASSAIGAGAKSEAESGRTSILHRNQAVDGSHGANTPSSSRLSSGSKATLERRDPHQDRAHTRARTHARERHLADHAAATPKSKSSGNSGKGSKKSDRAQELERLEMAARKLREQMAEDDKGNEDSEEQTPSDASSAAASPRTRPSTAITRSSQADDEYENQAEIEALKRQIMALQNSHAPSRRKAHPALGNFSVDDDEFDSQPVHPDIVLARQYPQNSSAAAASTSSSASHRHQQHKSSGRTRTSAREMDSLRADGAVSSRSRQSSSSAARHHHHHHQHQHQHQHRRHADVHTPSALRRHELPRSAIQSESEEDDFPPTSSQMSVSTGRTRQKRSVQPAEPNAGNEKLQELSQKIDLLEQIIRGTPFGSGQLAPPIVLAQQQTESRGATGSRAPIRPRPVELDSDTDLTDDWGASGSPRLLQSTREALSRASQAQAFDGRRGSASSLTNIPVNVVPAGGSGLNPAQQRSAFRHINSAENLGDSLRRKQAQAAQLQYTMQMQFQQQQEQEQRQQHQHQNAHLSNQYRRSISPVATITSAFRFNATPALHQQQQHGDGGSQHGHEYVARALPSTVATGKSGGGGLKSLFGVGTSGSHSHGQQQQQQQQHQVKFSNGLPGHPESVPMGRSPHGLQPSDTRSIGSGEHAVGGTSGSSKEVLLSFSRKRTEKVVIPKAKIKQAAGRGRVYITPKE